MASQTEIVNRALMLLGADTVTSLADSGKPARIMAVLWDQVRQEELRKNYWNFAIARVSLPSLSVTPDWGFGLAYQLPSDFIRVIQIGDYTVAPSLADYIDADTSLYAIEDGKILTDMGAPLKIKYVKNVTDPGAFDPLFCAVLSARLATVACESITNSSSKKSDVATEYLMAVKAAVRANAIEQPPQSFADDSWIEGRL